MDHEEIELLRVLTEQLSVALEGARLYQDTNAVALEIGSWPMFRAAFAKPWT